jgi:hypothetical protein
MNEAAYISSIETYLEQKLRVVSDNVYAGTLPSTLPTGTSDFVLIDCNSDIYDQNAYDNGVVAIYLYAMPSGKTKNVPLLSRMEKAYDQFLEDSDNENYVINQISRKSGYESTYGMHFIYSAINLIVK